MYTILFPKIDLLNVVQVHHSSEGTKQKVTGEDGKCEAKKKDGKKKMKPDGKTAPIGFRL